MAEYPEASGLVVTTPIELTYAIVIERAPGNSSAYGPDLPDCITVGDTIEEPIADMREAISLRLDGMHEDGDPIPPPTARVATVTVRDPRA